MNVAPLFSVLYICWSLRYGKTNNVVKDVLRSALPLARARKPSLHGPHRSTQTSASFDADICIVRRRHPHRSAQPSASVGAAIRIGRRRHPHRSAQTSVSVDADVLIGGYGIPAIPTQPPHAIRTQSPPCSHPYAAILLADCVEECVKSQKRYAPKGQHHIAQGSALG